jgi:hypothetical protein
MLLIINPMEVHSKVINHRSCVRFRIGTEDEISGRKRDLEVIKKIIRQKDLEIKTLPSREDGVTYMGR